MPKFCLPVLFLLANIALYGQRSDLLNTDLVLVKGGANYSIVHPGEAEQTSILKIGECNVDARDLRGEPMFRKTEWVYYYLLDPLIAPGFEENKGYESLQLIPQEAGLFTIGEYYARRTCMDECRNTKEIVTNCNESSGNLIGNFTVKVVDFEKNQETTSIILKGGNAVDLNDFYELSAIDENGRISINHPNVNNTLLSTESLEEGENTVNVLGTFENGNKTLELLFEVVDFRLTQGNSFEVCSFDDGLIDLRAYYSPIDFSNINIQYSGSGIVNDHFLDLSQLQNGTNRVTIGASGFINGYKTLHIDFIKNPLPNISAGADQEVCFGEELNLAGGQPIGGDWSSEQLLIEENNKVDIAGVQPGTYTVTYTYNDGACSGTATKKVIVNPLPETSAGDNISWCGKGQISLMGFSPEGGSWSSGSNQLIVNGNFAVVGEIDFEGNLSKDFTLSYTYQNEVGCSNTSNRTLTVYSEPEIPEISHTKICGSGQTTLNIENYNPQYIYDWYENNQKLVGVTGNTYTTGILQEDRQFQVIAYNPEKQNCQSVGRADVTITSLPARPLTNDVVICEVEKVTLNASYNGAIDYFTWYDQNENILSSGEELNDSYTTITAITQDVSFFVSATVNGCESEKKEIKIFKNNPPNKPEVKGDTHCGEGEVSLLVTSNEGDSYRWYESETSSEILYEGKEYKPFLDQTTSYYIAAVNRREIPGLGTYDCESEREIVSGEILNIPASPEEIAYTTCGFELVELSGRGGIGENYNWYDVNGLKVGEGKTFKLGQVSRNETYNYSTFTSEDCESDRSQIEITYRSPPSFPQIEAIEICGEGEVMIVPEGEEGASFRFYLENDRNNYVFEGENYSPYIKDFTRIYVSQVIGNCEGPQQSIEVVFHPEPEAPIAEDVSYCGANTIQLTASGGSAGSQYNWYESLEAETPIAIGSSFTQNNLSETTAFYVSFSSRQGCESARTKVTAFVYEVPPAPKIKAAYICSEIGEATLAIEESNPSYVYEWYDASNQLLFTGELFVTPMLTQTTTYKIRAVSPENCEGEFASTQAVIIQDEPVDIGDDITLCKWSDTYNLNSDISLEGGVFSGPGVFNDSLFTPEVLEVGEHEVRYTYLKGDCVANGTRNITITDGIGEEAIDLGNEKIEMCENSFSIDLNAYTTYEGGTWSGEGVVNNFLDPTQLSPGNHELEYAVDINGCQYNAIKDVEIIKSFAEKPRLSKSNLTACPDEEIEVIASVAQSNTGYQWFNEDTRELLGEGTSFVYQVQESFLLSCQGVDAKGCGSPPTLLNVEVYDFPDSIIASKEQTKVYEPIEFDVLDADANNNSYFWDFGDGQVSTVQSPAIFYYQEGDYQIGLTITNSTSNCVKNIKKTVIVDGLNEVDSIITGINETSKISDIKIAPNPFSNFLKVEAKGLGNGLSVQIYDLLGKAFWYEEFTRQEESTILIDTNELAPGLYIIRINSKTFKLTKL